MASKLYYFVAWYFWSLAYTTLAQNLMQFTYNGFQQAKLHLDGGATIHPNGLLQLTNFTKQLSAHAFLSDPLKFHSPSRLSFSTTFAFAIYPQIQAISGHGLVLVFAPSMDLVHGFSGKYLGLFDASTVGNISNHVFAVELDTLRNMELEDIDSNHVGIDVNNVVSIASASAAYFSDTKRENVSLNLLSAKPMQIWVDYDDINRVINVTMAPLGLSRPSKPLLSSNVNLSAIFLDTMYVGFSSSTGSVKSIHYVLGWSFSQGRQAHAQGLDLKKLPSLPRVGNKEKKFSRGSMILVIFASAMVMSIALGLYMRWEKKYEEVLEDWEKEYLLQRFSYRDLYKATQGFKDKVLLGAGGFGKVYKGILPSKKVEVAVKKVSHGSNQGMKEFVAEIACMGRLRHRNLVQLLGYCRRKGELMLVYDYMPNGSLDKYLYHGKADLSWSQRYNIIKGVASALVYLHEEWEQVVIHRDVKASNVLLDANMNARLGDFGLARLYDHGTNPQTTHIVGTIGYLAPELTRRGKATTSTDVFSFGIFILEVACGRAPISTLEGDGEKYLVDWVYDCWKRDTIIEASDPRLSSKYVVQEMELVLKLGMICSHTSPEVRPNMRQIMQFLGGENELPAIIPHDAKPDLSMSNNTTLPPFDSSSRAISTSYSTDSVLIFGR